MYSGSLSTPSGLDGTGRWSTSSSISWEIGWDDSKQFWTYEYTLDLNRKDISHIILELSDDPGSEFTKTDFIGGPYAGEFGSQKKPKSLSYEIGLFSSKNGGSNPYLPEAVYGVKIDLPGSLQSSDFTFWFATTRDPVWGDIYAKSGNGTTISNAGFAAIDPLSAPSDGTVDYHLLVPDGASLGPTSAPASVPHPSALVGLISALGICLPRLLRRNRSAAQREGDKKIG